MNQQEKKELVRNILKFNPNKSPDTKKLNRIQQEFNKKYKHSRNPTNDDTTLFDVSVFIEKQK